MNPLPIVVIGAGPVGLAAAAHLFHRQLPFLVFEAGPSVGHHIQLWGHVRLFSPWRYLVDPAAAALLKPTGWTQPPPEEFPLGGELRSTYLEPLGTLLAEEIRTNHRVVSISRVGHDRMKDGRRGEVPFALMVNTPHGRRRVLARAVIDASGTWGQPNPLGAGGVSADGEDALSDVVEYGIPDIAAQPGHYRHKRVLVVGSGHSAMHALLALAAIPDTRIAWGVRRPDVGGLWGGGANDELPARGSQGSRVKAAVDEGKVHVVSALSIGAVERDANGVEVTDVDGNPRCNVDHIIVATGSRPDLSLTRELRLQLDPPTEAVLALGPLIDPNHHRCGTVAPHGVVELTHAHEPGFYTVGMKSYGRAPTFLMLTGYEQVRSVVAELAGDHDAARRVELELPQTGVCGVGGGETTQGCC